MQTFGSILICPLCNTAIPRNQISSYSSVIPLVSDPYCAAAVSPYYSYTVLPLRHRTNQSQQSSTIPPTKPTRELISFAITLHEYEPNTTFISRGKPNQKNEPHKDKKSTKQERRKKGRKERNRTNTTTAAAKDLQPAAKTCSLRTAT